MSNDVACPRCGVTYSDKEGHECNVADVADFADEQITDLELRVEALESLVSELEGRIDVLEGD